MNYYFDPHNVEWLFVVVENLVALAIVAIIFITYEIFHLETWRVRKIGHISINTVLALTPYFFKNFFDLVVALLILFAIVGILSLIPQIQLLQKLIKYATRNDEKPIVLLINVVVTALVILILFLIFFNKIYVYTSAVLALSVGDGLGEIIGRPYGRIKYKIFAQKSLEGSLGVLVGAFLSLLLSIGVAGLLNTDAFWKILTISVLVAITESFSFRFFDNVSIPCVTATLVYYLFP